MSRNQRAPFIAFVLVAIVCGLIVVDALVSGAQNARPQTWSGTTTRVAPGAAIVREPLLRSAAAVRSVARHRAPAPAAAAAVALVGAESSQVAAPVHRAPRAPKAVGDPPTPDVVAEVVDLVDATRNDVAAVPGADLHPAGVVDLVASVDRRQLGRH